MNSARVTLAFLVLAAGAAVPAAAGEIYGRITDGKSPVAEGTAVELRCGDKAYAPTATDKAGAYHLVADKPGKCTLTVRLKGESASLGVASFDDPVQVDLVVERKDGKLSLRRS